MRTPGETAVPGVREQVRQALVMYVDADEVDDALLMLTRKGLLRPEPRVFRAGEPDLDDAEEWAEELPQNIADAAHIRATTPTLNEDAEGLRKRAESAPSPLGRAAIGTENGAI